MRILLYHDVIAAPVSGRVKNYGRKHIPFAAFRRHIAFLRAVGDIVPLSSVLHPLHALRPQFVLTFDDGYRGLYDSAWPFLREQKIPFSFFPVTGFLDGEPLWVDRLEYALEKTEKPQIEIFFDSDRRIFSLTSVLERRRADSAIRAFAKTLPGDERNSLIAQVGQETGYDLKNHLDEETMYQPIRWEELKEMAQTGLVEIGGHTLTHPILSHCALEAVRQEIAESKKTLEVRLSARVRYFAYPNGKPEDFNSQTVQIVREAGFDAAFTTVPGRARVSSPFAQGGGEAGDRFTVPRFACDATETLPRFVATITGFREPLSRMKHRLFKRGRTSIPDTVAYFHAIASSYRKEYDDETPNGYSFRVRRRKAMEILSDLPSGARVLDLGCGPGVFAGELGARGFAVTGVDPAEGMIAIARREHPGVEFHVARAQALPFPEASFDAVIASGLVEYFDAHACVQALTEINRILTPGGTLIISFPNFANLCRAWDRALAPLLALRRAFLRRPQGMAHREFRVSESNALLRAHGFFPREHAYYNAKLLCTPLDRIFPRISVRISRLCEGSTPSFLHTGFLVKAVRL